VVHILNALYEVCFAWIIMSRFFQIIVISMGKLSLCKREEGAGKTVKTPWLEVCVFGLRGGEEKNA